MPKAMTTTQTLYIRSSIISRLLHNDHLLWKKISLTSINKRKIIQRYNTTARTFASWCLAFCLLIGHCTSLLAIHHHQGSVLVHQLLAGVMRSATHLLISVVNERIPVKQIMSPQRSLSSVM